MGVLKEEVKRREEKDRDVSECVGEWICSVAARGFGPSFAFFVCVTLRWSFCETCLGPFFLLSFGKRNVRVW